MSVELSAIVQAPHGFDAVRTTLRHLAAQSIAERMEIVLVAPSRAELALDFLARLFDESGPAPHVDWERYRIMQLIPGTAGVADAAARDRLIERGFIELAKGGFDEAAQRRSIESLRSLVGQVLGTRHRVLAFQNPMVEAMAAGPAPSTPPNLARLLSAVAEIVQRATSVTVAAEADAIGERLMTLLFVDGAYVGFLPGKRDVSNPVGKA